MESGDKDVQSKLYKQYLDANIIGKATTKEMFYSMNDEQAEVLFKQGRDAKIIGDATDLNMFIGGVRGDTSGKQSAVVEQKVASTTADVSQAADTELSLEDTSLESLEVSSKEKPTLVERAFGKNEVTDFFGDIYRAGSQGYLQSELVDPSIDVLNSGAESSDQEILRFIETQSKISENSSQSDEMKSFDKAYDEEGGGFFGFIAGVIESPTVLPSLLVSSLSTQVGSLRSDEVVTATAVGAGGGAVIGSVVPGIGTATGAISGAFAAGAATMEAGLTFAELLQEKIQGEMTIESVRAILDSPEEVEDLKNKAISRGVAIGLVEGLTAGLAKGATGAISKTVKTSKTVAGRTASKVAAGAAGGAIEVVGGGGGEVAGRLAAGQEMDAKEIGFEAVVGLSTAPVTVLPTLAKIKTVSERVKLTNEAKRGGYNTVHSAFKPDSKIDETTLDLASSKNSSNLVDEQVEIEVANKRMSQEEADAIKITFRETQSAVNTVNKQDRLKGDSKIEAVELLKEGDRLEKKIKDIDNSSLSATESNRLAEIKIKLESLVKGETVAETEKPSPIVSEDNIFTDPTDEQYASINRNDGKGNQTISKAEYDAIIIEQESNNTNDSEVVSEEAISDGSVVEEDAEQELGSLKDSNPKKSQIYLDRKIKVQEKFKKLIAIAKRKYSSNKNSTAVSDLEQKRDEALADLSNKEDAESNKSKGKVEKLTNTPLVEEDNDDINQDDLDDLDISINEMEDSRPELVGKNTIDDGGETFEIFSIQKKKDGTYVVKAKQRLTTSQQNKRGKGKSGTIKRYSGQDAERIVKDSQLGVFSERARPAGKEKVKTKGKSKPLAPSSKTTYPSREKPTIVVKSGEEIESELEAEIAKIEAEVVGFEEAVVDELASKDATRDLVTFNGNIYQVTEKPNGEFAVSKMRSPDGKLVNLGKDTIERKKAISQYKRKKTIKSKESMTEAEQLLDDYKKQSQDRIEKALDNAIEALALGKLRGQMNDVTTVLGTVVANGLLRAVRVSYKLGMTLVQAVDYHYVTIKDSGVSKKEFYRFVKDSINSYSAKNKVNDTSKSSKGNVEESAVVSKPTVDTVKGMKKKPAPKDVKTETEGLTLSEQVNQGLEELLAANKEKNQVKKAAAIEKSKANLEKAKKSLKARISKLKNNNEARKILSTEAKKIIKESKLSEFSKGTINKIITNVNKANTSNLLKMVDEIADVVNRDISRKDRLKRIKDRGRAIKNIRNLGDIRKVLKDDIKNFTGLNHKYLSPDALIKYDEVISNLVPKGKVLSNEKLSELIKEVNSSFKSDLLDAEALIDRIEIDESKSFTENLKALLKNKEIKKEQYDLLLRFKDLMLDTKEDPTDGMTKEEIDAIKGEKDAAKRKAAEDDFSEAMFETKNPIREPNENEKIAIKTAKSLTLVDTEGMNISQLRKLNSGLELLNSGMVGSDLFESLEIVYGLRDKRSIPTTEISESGVIDKTLSKVRSGVKNIFISDKNKKEISIKNRLRSAPIINIEQVLKTQSKKFKSTNIYQALFRPSAVAFANVEDKLNDNEKTLKAAESLLSSNQNKNFEQKSRIMIFQIQKEFESNPDNKEVTPAAAWINFTIKSKESIYDESELAILQEILDKYSVDGEIDLASIENSFTDKENKSKKLIRNVYLGFQDLAKMDAERQGLPFVLRENYVHLPEDSNKRNEVTESLDDLKTSFTKPSVKSKLLIQRNGKAHLISFDPIQNAYSASRKTITSFYMSPVIKRAKVAFRALKKEVEGTKNSDLVQSLEEVYDDILRFEYQNVTKNKALIESVIDVIGKAGYIAQLAGPVKASFELASNATHAVLSRPLAFISGVNALSDSNVSRAEYDRAIKALPTTQKARISGDADLSSKEVESRLTSEKNLFKSGKTTSEGRAFLKQGLSFLSKPLKASYKFNESLIARPDTTIARPLFVGAFNESFKKYTGKNPDWKKLSSDASYRDEFSEAIEQATLSGDRAVTDSVASNNPFEGISKNIKDKDASSIRQAIQMANRYMTRFRVFEYYSAVKGVENLLGKGEISRVEAGMLLTATVARMTMYKMGIDITMSLIYQAMGIDDEEDEVDLDKDLTKSVLSAIVTLSMGRNIGNLAQMPFNYGVEWLNKSYGDGFTREGEYNSFKDGVVWNKIPLDDNIQDDLLSDMLISSLGPFNPMAKTIFRGSTLAGRTVKSKKEETRERNMNELLTRIPFEVVGNLGIIPAYKDLRKIYLKSLFNDRDKKDNKKSTSKGSLMGD